MNDPQDLLELALDAHAPEPGVIPATAWDKILVIPPRVTSHELFMGWFDRLTRATAGASLVYCEPDMNAVRRIFAGCGKTPPLLSLLMPRELPLVPTLTALVRT